MLYLYKRSLGTTKKYATISGQGYERSPIDIGRWRYVVFGGLAAFFLLAILAPVLLLIYTSLMPYYIPPHALQNFGIFTVDPYRAVLADGRVLGAIRNSFIVAFLATGLLIAGSILGSWIVHKTDVRFRNLIDYLSFSVIGLPSIPLAVGLIYVYLLYIPKGDIIYNSFAILIIAMYTRFISATVKVIEPGVIQVKQELLEAGELAGDTVVGRLRNIVLPLIKQSAQAALAMRFSIIFMEFPIAVMLQTRETEMVAAALLTMQTQAQFPHIAAFGVVIMIILGAMTLFVHRF
jgi:iron(III) transport system permease protein